MTASETLHLCNRHTGGVRADEQHRINGARRRQRLGDEATDARAANAQRDEVGGKSYEKDGRK